MQTTKKKINDLENNVFELKDKIYRISRNNTEKSKELEIEIRKLNSVTDATLQNHKENIEIIYRKMKNISFFLGIFIAFTIFTVIVFLDNETLKNIKDKVHK